MSSRDNDVHYTATLLDIRAKSSVIEQLFSGVYNKKKKSYYNQKYGTNLGVPTYYFSCCVSKTSLTRRIRQFYYDLI